MFIIYGAGNVGKGVFRVLTDHGIPVIGFFDKGAKPGDCWNGIPIFQSDDRRISICDRKKIGVIIAVHNRDAAIPPIIRWLNACGYTRVVTLIESYDYFGKELGDRFWLTDRSYYRSFDHAIIEGFSVWADDTSRATYSGMLRFRLTGDYSLLPKPDIEHQYFPPDLPAWRQPLRFVDCGAYDGDTLVSLVKAGISVDAVTAFGPDHDNFRKLAQFVRMGGTALGSVTLWPCGVYSTTGLQRFSVEGGEASRLSPAGDATIQCVSLDEVIPHFRPTLMKIDIEGLSFGVSWALAG